MVTNAEGLALDDFGEERMLIAPVGPSARPARRAAVEDGALGPPADRLRPVRPVVFGRLGPGN